jgi:hypothetical protein
MRERVYTAVSIIAGLLALLLCMAAPTTAMPVSHDMVSAHADMPCCPEKAPAAAKTCGQQCPLLAQAEFHFEYTTLTLLMRYVRQHDHFASLTYQPQAPPPR